MKLAVLAAVVLVSSCTSDDRMSLRSTAFEDGGDIPERHTCEGENLSPPLSWSRVPDAAAELALVVADPDGDGDGDEGVFHQWVLLGIEPRTGRMAEGDVPPGSVQAMGSSENATWIGPCPPSGQEHDYVFTLYPLERKLGLDAGVDLRTALDAIDDARLRDEEAVLEGRYRAAGGPVSP